MHCSYLSNSGKVLKTNPDVSELDLTWLAAAIDMEGCICTENIRRKDGSIRPTIKIGFANTDWRLIKKYKTLLNKLTGFKYAASQKPKLQSHHKMRWEVLFNKRRALIIFLQTIHPYLISKKDRAELALKLLKITGGRLETIPPKALEYSAEIRRLNHTGFGPESARNAREQTADIR